MADTSIFLDKDTKPGNEELKAALGKLYRSWVRVVKYAIENGPGTEEWHYSKSGWNCRIKGKKSVIIYLMPGDRHFRASFVLGGKATTEALESNIPDDIKKLISEAKVYAEGRGVRIDVTSDKMTAHIETLINIKLSTK